MALVTYQFKLSPSKKGSAPGLSNEPITAEMKVPDKYKDTIMPELVDQMKYELPYYRYNDTLCECLSTNIDYTVPADDFSISCKNLSSDHVVQLTYRFKEIALDLEIDFLSHEPIRDPELRKRIHKELDETLDKLNNLARELDKTRRELPHIEQLPPSDRKPAPEVEGDILTQTEAHKRIHERASHRTAEQHKQAHERVQQRARSRTPEQRKASKTRQIRTRKKQLQSMKASMTRYQQANARVSGIFALLGRVLRELSRIGHQQAYHPQRRSGRNIERDRGEERER